MENDTINCPFRIGEIVIFESSLLFEAYIGQVRQVHLDYYPTGLCPVMYKATTSEKELWYNSGKPELTIKTIDHLNVMQPFLKQKRITE